MAQTFNKWALDLGLIPGSAAFGLAKDAWDAATTAANVRLGDISNNGERKARLEAAISKLSAIHAQR
jgi:hypothetical protein